MSIKSQDKIRCFCISVFCLFVLIGFSQKKQPKPISVVSQVVENMVFIPGGAFMMGDNDGYAKEKPVHEVTLSSFYLYKYEISVSEYKKFVDDTGYITEAEQKHSVLYWDHIEPMSKPQNVNWKCDSKGEPRAESSYNHPVAFVTWYDAVEYCKWLSLKTGRNFRLPTEAEWEYAAGNGTKHTKYSWGNDPPKNIAVANASDSSYKKITIHTNPFPNYNDGFAFTAPVDSYQPNEFGLFNMSGNIYEWCEDWYDENYYSYSPTLNPKGPSSVPGTLYKPKSVRGGSFTNSKLGLRVAHRASGHVEKGAYNITFRVVMDP